MDAMVHSANRRIRQFPGYTTLELRQLAKRSNLTAETRGKMEAEIAARDLETNPPAPKPKVQEYELYSAQGGCVVHVGTLKSCLTCLAEITGDSPLHEVLETGWEIRVHHG